MGLHKVKILRNNEIQEAEIETVREIKDGYRFTVISIKFENIFCFAADEYPFFALCDLRNKLERKFNTKLLCMGSQINVYPSGMQYIMETAHILRIGKQCRIKDIVGIFDECSDVKKIGTVEEQRKFKEEYYESMKPPPEVDPDLYK